MGGDNGISCATSTNTEVLPEETNVPSSVTPCGRCTGVTTGEPSKRGSNSSLRTPLRFGVLGADLTSALTSKNFHSTDGGESTTESARGMPQRSATADSS